MSDPTPADLLAARPHLAVHAADGLLLEGVPLAAIADETGTPSWVTGATTFRARIARLAAALRGVHLHYAVKANDHLAILALAAGAGIGADVVSGGELRRAVAAGFAPARIVFSGVGKTADELRLALAAGIGQINVESPEELLTLSAIAASEGATATVALRVNPDVDARTHEKIATGRAGDKFGIPWPLIPALYARAAALPGIRPVGLAVHIGSQLHDAAPYRAAYARLAGLVRDIRAAGHAVQAVDCGGGLGFPYQGEPALLPEAWAGAIAGALAGMDLTLSAEPGRWIAAPASLLLTRVIRVRREGMPRPMLVLDAAMNDLLRPAMYHAWHGMLPVAARDLAGVPEPTDVVGPVCESSDVFARARPLPPLAEGALVAILDAGAYGAVMSGAYNSRPRAPQVMVDRGRVATIRPRQPPECLWSDETVPPFLAARG